MHKIKNLFLSHTSHIPSVHQTRVASGQQLPCAMAQGEDISIMTEISTELSCNSITD